MAQVVITGANRGIGLAMTRQLVERGDKVLAVVRQSSEELDALGVEVITGVDFYGGLTVSVACQEIAERLAGSKIDLLINNAGIFRNETLDNMDFRSIEEQFAINAIAPLRVTHGLAEQLAEGGKVAMITSRMGSISDNDSGSYYGYRASKAALNAFGKSLACDLAPRGIAVALLHPGLVSTRMVNFNGDVSPEDSAAGLLARIDSLNSQNSGQFWHANGDDLPW